MTDPISGRATGLPKTIRRAAKAMEASGIGYCVIGAAALAARGLPRMTRDLDIAVLSDDAEAAIAALRKANLVASTPIHDSDALESMIIFVDPQTQHEVDLLIAEGEPEASAIAHATREKLFGASMRVASLEHLLLLYLYSNQPRHLGDFASIVKSGRADLAKAEHILHEMHPEMMRDWRQRVKSVLSPPPAPQKPKRK
ncbi:MAG TPA: hypothetical protein VKX17_14895 [Planctomycetota bacterium]|nr:hypothetical protein [Planctomycetota bacterium]